MKNRFQSADIDMMSMSKMNPLALIGLRIYYILHGKNQQTKKKCHQK
ncbi:hypothetical protein B14911_15407 [Bacillus sp. NRRL B-14911]|uniref:Uncharacterized protein n=1 Tax=Bacillus infantis NRRL B-14911 TaxID=1367477 RepID=U5L7E8_9BACI|nr:hypothetical protein N288_06680 [Bacillus infantis NRRL B-14911]EAR66767.1 hypothetical protein B14911_15407 [Bacillus sp. NRRL B-14911]